MFSNIILLLGSIAVFILAIGFLWFQITNRVSKEYEIYEIEIEQPVLVAQTHIKVKDDLRYKQIKKAESIADMSDSKIVSLVLKFARHFNKHPKSIRPTSTKRGKVSI